MQTAATSAAAATSADSMHVHTERARRRARTAQTARRCLRQQRARNLAAAERRSEPSDGIIVFGGVRAERNQHTHAYRVRARNC